MSAGYDGCWQTDESKQGNRRIFVSMIGVQADSYQDFLKALWEGKKGAGGGE